MYVFVFVILSGGLVVLSKLFIHVHVGNTYLYVNTSPLHVLVQVPVSPFPVLKEMYMYLLHSVWFFLSSLYSSSFCSLWCTRHMIVHVHVNPGWLPVFHGSPNIFPSLSSCTCIRHIQSDTEKAGCHPVAIAWVVEH